MSAIRPERRPRRAIRRPRLVLVREPVPPPRRHLLRPLVEAGRRVGRLARGGAAALTLGLIETFTSVRGRRALALCALGAAGLGLALRPPVAAAGPGELLVRQDLITGQRVVTRGAALALPGLHAVERLPGRSRVRHLIAAGLAELPYRTRDGLAVDLPAAVVWTPDPERLRAAVAPAASDDWGELVERLGRRALGEAIAGLELRSLARPGAGETPTLLEAIDQALAPHGLRALDLVPGPLLTAPEVTARLPILMLPEDERAAAEARQAHRTEAARALEEVEAAADEAREDERARARADADAYRARAIGQAVAAATAAAPREVRSELARRLVAVASGAEPIEDEE